MQGAMPGQEKLIRRTPLWKHTCQVPDPSPCRQVLLSILRFLPPSVPIPAAQQELLPHVLDLPTFVSRSGEHAALRAKLAEVYIHA